MTRGTFPVSWLSWPGALAKPRWLVAIGGAIVALAVAGGIILILSQPPSRLLASACGADACRQGVSLPFGDANPPAGAPALMPQAGHRTHPPATLSTAQPTPRTTGSHPAPSPTSSSPGQQPTSSPPAPTPTPTSPDPAPTTTTPSPTSTPTTSPTQTSVQVSYALVRQHPHSFQGQFTIVNNGSTAINGWELAVVLPGDHIRSVWDGSFHTHGDTLYIDPSSSQLTIAPGAAITENFTAGGSTTTPTSCRFNGSAC